MRNYSKDAKELLTDVSLYKLPVNPVEICSKLGVHYQEAEYDGFDGTLIVVGDSQLIGVNSNIKEPGRRAYTCAHEIGHYYYDLATETTFRCTRDDTGHGGGKLDEKEIRANEFASELLMPKDLLLAEMKNQAPSWSIIEKLATKCGTSLQATANRFIKLTHHSCWLVVVRKGKLQRFAKADHNQFFPNLDGKFKAPQIMPSDWKSTLALSWLYENRNTKNKQLLYWPRPENQYGESLVLLWDKGNTLTLDQYAEDEDTEVSQDQWDRRRRW